MSLVKIAVEYFKEKRLEEVKKCIKGRLLDIGCGDNVLVKIYYKNGLGIDVIDYYGNVDIVVESSANIPMENSSFDTVTIVAALNHIPNYQATLAESFRLLKQDGRIVITMPICFPQKMWHKIAHDYDDDQIFRGIDEKEERYCIPVEEIEYSLKKTGFTNIKRKRFLLGLNNIILAEKDEKFSHKI